MKRVENNELTGVPIKMWLYDLEDSAMEQVYNLSNLPFIFRHVVVLPDSHMGWGMPIGSVIATQDVIIPNSCGSDIGCGMCAVKTNVKVNDRGVLDRIVDKVYNTIPLGFHKHQGNKREYLMPQIKEPYLNIVEREWDNAVKSLGTLGGGNHFIELQVDPDGYMWIMIHSGSRNLGKQVADHYNDIAVKMNEKYHSSVPKEWKLAFLPLDSKDGQIYLNEMNYCVDFALRNRQVMMGEVVSIIDEFIDGVKYEDVINIAHNYARMENHFGKNVMVHRKGATDASKDTIGIIPGSQGTCSYIVKGLGERESFHSCSHGAGRKMSRTQAKKTLVLEDEKKILDDQEIIHRMNSISSLDEAPGSYKDIYTVMENQNDLVEILVKLRPIAVIKG